METTITNVGWLNAVLGWLLTHGVQIMIVLVGAFVMLQVVQRVLEKTLQKFLQRAYKPESEEAFKKRKKTLQEAAGSAITIIIWLLAFMMIVSELGVDIGPLIAAAGVVGIALGFGGQYLIRDVIAGAFILAENQYREGDVVTIADTSGLVEDMNLRRTVLRDLDGTQHYIPNGEITKASNMTKYWSRIHLDISVDYDTNLDHAIEVLNRLGEEFAHDPKWKSVITQAPRVLGVDGFADSAIILKVLGETKPAQQWDATREFRKRLKAAFESEGTTIPFPHQVNIDKTQRHAGKR